MVSLSSLNPFGFSVKSSTLISDLRIYPVKSCRGISLEASTLTRKGLDLDRNWMFIDPNTRKFLTIRDVSNLTLIQTAFAPSASPNADASELDLELVLTVRTMPQVCTRLPARPSKSWLEENTVRSEVEIWGDKTDAWLYRDEVNKPFADLLQRQVALAYKGPTPRHTKGNASLNELGRQESINFPDFGPVLIANEKSMNELSHRLNGKGIDDMTYERFRPNIIVKGGEPGVQAWDEDKWKTLRVVNGSPSSSSWISWGPSTLDIDVVCHCARCQVPNVDPETAEKNKHEPWDTLVSYRRIDEGIKFKPCFGMLCCPRNEGPIAVGMELQVLETTDKHFFKKN